jgi:hypothetical protein
MKTRTIAWALITGTAAVTAVGAFVPESSLAIGSVVLGGVALATAAHVRFQTARKKISEKVLEQLR